MRIRIKDIARLAQVSPGTVDRVIHHRGEVSEPTRIKIEKIISELDYQPDILAQTLASKRNRLFAVLMPVSANGTGFWQAPNKGIDKALQEIRPFGVAVQRFFYEMDEKKSFEKQSALLLKEKPDAVLFAPVYPQESLRFISLCRELGIPVTLFNSTFDELQDVYYIGQDARQSGFLAAKLLSWGIPAGGDILILNMSGRKDNHNHIITREHGFRSYFTSAELNGFELHTIELQQAGDPYLNDSLQSAFDRRWVKGIFVTNSQVFRVASFIQLTQRKGIRLIGYDLLPENIAFLRSGIIDFLISQKPEEQGYQGIMSMFSRFVLNRPVPQNQFIPIDILAKENIDYYEFR